MTLLKEGLLMRYLALILVCIFSAPAQGGEITEFELPGLYGTYNGSQERFDGFTFVRLPGEIYNLQLRLTGVLHPGTMECFGGSIPQYMSLGLNYSTSIWDPDAGPEGMWEAAYEQEPGDYLDWSDVPFEFTVTYSPQSGTGEDFLSGGTGSVILDTVESVPNPGDCWRTVKSSCEITGAALIVDADIIVSTGYSSWGAIKSLMK